jgi:hypothetical protein
LRLIFPRDTATSDSIAEWVMRNLGWRAVKPYRAIGAIDDRGELVAGVVWNGYNAANVDMTAYAPGRISRRALRAIFTYAFLDLKATRITARTRRGRMSADDRARIDGAGGLLERMGFICEGSARHYYGPGKANDAVIYRMLRHECPWIGVDHGRRTRGTGPKGNGRRADADEPRNGRHSDRA